MMPIDQAVIVRYRSRRYARWLVTHPGASLRERCCALFGHRYGDREEGWLPTLLCQRCYHDKFAAAKRALDAWVNHQRWCPDCANRVKVEVDNWSQRRGLKPGITLPPWCEAGERLRHLADRAFRAMYPDESDDRDQPLSHERVSSLA